MKSWQSTLQSALVLTVALAAAGLARADNWPNWRGPDNDGVSTEKIATNWGPDKNIAWKLKMPGSGGATPAIWGDRIFVTSAEDKGLVLLCINTKGKILWKRAMGTATRTAIRKDEANQASASPSTDGKYVYAFVGTGDFACFDFEGKEQWTFNAQDRYGKFSIQHGMHSTPLLYGDRLYLSLLHGKGHWLIALDKATGKEVWKVARPTDARSESKEAYTSPCIFDNGGEKVIVILGADYTTAHSLKDGATVWKMGDLNPKDDYSNAFRIIASPVAHGNELVVPTARGKWVVAVRPGAKGDFGIGSDAELWRNAKGSPDVPSPLIYKGITYLCRENGVLIALDSKTGKELYQGRLHNSRYRASPVLANGLLYLTARDGTFSVVKAGPKFDLVTTNVLEDSFTASPAIADGTLYLRGFDYLYAIRGK